MKTNIIIYILCLIIFLIICSMADGKTSIAEGLILIAILMFIVFPLKKGYKKEELNEDCSMDE